MRDLSRSVPGRVPAAPTARRRARFAPGAMAALCALPLLGGCDMVVMNPAGDVARQQANLVLWSTGLMLLIIVPVIVLTVLFAWKYRATNEDAEYRPDWDHSTGLELVIWSAPLLIVIALGALTWVATHTLDPYRPLNRIAPGKPLPAAGTANSRPLEIQVVSLDWKWLFIYPEQGVATINELVLPVDRQVRFRLTSSTVMNTFYVPAMAGMIYTMPGMETKLHAVLNRPGRFQGMSANYSGAGFSYMNFWTHSVDQAGFDRWVAAARRAPSRLTIDDYRQLEKPSERVPAIRFGTVERDLFRRVVEQCAHPGQPCMSETMRHDMGEPGSHAPVNDAPPRAGEPEGALMKDRDDKGSSPHSTTPRSKPPGNAKPGDPENRTMTMTVPDSTDRPRVPGTRPAASA